MIQHEYYRCQWHKVTEDQAKAITGCTTHPDEVYAYPLSGLLSSMQGISGIESAYVSGAIESFDVPGEMKAFCELVVIREEGLTARAYNWIFASTGTDVYMYGPETNFPEHHIPVGDPIPIHSLFGHVSPPGTIIAPAEEE